MAAAVAAAGDEVGIIFRKSQTILYSFAPLVVELKGS